MRGAMEYQRILTANQTIHWASDQIKLTSTQLIWFLGKLWGMWNKTSEKTQTQRIKFSRKIIIIVIETIAQCNKRDEMRWGWCTLFNFVLYTQIHMHKHNGNKTPVSLNAIRDA